MKYDVLADLDDGAEMIDLGVASLETEGPFEYVSETSLGMISYSSTEPG